MTEAVVDWQVLKFQPWNSAPDVSFWQTLASLKLDKFQLNDQAQDITGYFTPGRSVNVPARFTIDESAFASAQGTQESRDVDRARYEWQAPGLLFNTNTLEDFKKLDKAKLLRDAGDKILDLILGNEDEDISTDHLNSFVLITFADLKKHSFLYWFGFPALSPPASFQYRSPPSSVSSVLSSKEQVQTLRGLAPIAAATAVELLVAVLHSPQGKYVGAEKPSDGSVPMGYIPHQLRGFLNAFQNMVITGEAFDKCIACGSKVLDAYSADSLGLLEKACNSTAYLEELTGLNQLTEEADSLMIDLEDSDEDGDMI
ncbi:AP-4 complex accessory subunit tepsin [Phytophthora nicotianae]|uniref:Ubiquitin-like modifier-activating enzyme ATG7 n=1 Tax=Phytophthora nicotianae TaxID=4792 RepID=A0A0W8DR71_PHYNI|nr:AP-4 complex accessory subunit tepsin [Phytophthora nicotianae]